MKNIRKIVFEKDFKIILLKNKINIINYYEVLEINDDNIILTYEFGKIIIKGSDLVLTKMLDCEILIEGNIKSVEL